jgi:uncharacterized membrane protein YgaE (UPF0421/DUF939 family)
MPPESTGLKDRISALIASQAAPRVDLSYALRTTSAAVASLLLCRVLHIETPIWAVVSSIVVILPEVHASIFMAGVRVVANLVGATVGVAIAAIGLPPLPSLVSGLLGVAGACRLLGIDVAARTASVAVVIVLLRLPGAELGTSETRVVLVMIGCLVGLAVTMVAAGIERALGE